jgi:hypothetical protein
MDMLCMTTGAWITLRVTHNSTAPATTKGYILGRNEREVPSGFHESDAEEGPLHDRRRSIFLEAKREALIEISTRAVIGL